MRRLVAPACRSARLTCRQLQLRKAVPDEDLKFRDVGTSMGRALLSCIIFCSESTIFLPDKERVDHIVIPVYTFSGKLIVCY